MNIKRGAVRRIAAALVAGVCAVAGASVGAGAPPQNASRQIDNEIRAMWVLRTSLTSPESIAELVRSARQAGFNTLFVQVRGRGDAYFRNGLEPLPADVLRRPSTFDPLAFVLESAHDAGLRVHAWVNVNLVSSAAELPAAREHIIYRHPDWLMVPRDIAQQLAAEDLQSPAYVGRLARWTRQRSTEVEGLYTSPIVPAAAQHTEAVVRDIARRYRVDGIHFDYARYPTERFDYSRTAIREFRTFIHPQLTDAQRQSLDAEEATDLFAYPDRFPDDWRRFRVERMTALIARLRVAVKEERPSATVSLAAVPDAREALSHRLQDWSAWLNGRLIDALCPMIYTQDASRFAEQVSAAREIAGGRPVWAGIGAYRLSPTQTIDNIHTARKLGAAGVILFSYDSLVNPQSEPGYLSTVGRAVFDTRPADHGSR
jgi:uncharacterized lipoprotein YddW (UPF0748 family)